MSSAGTAPAPSDSVTPERRTQLRRATLASTVGSGMEYYDFALYGLSAAVIFGELFFPALGAASGLIASLGVYGVGFVARPVGGLVFGRLGDRVGRKNILVITILLMGGGTTLIGVLPTGETIGIWAPVLLVLLRIVQGFGAGAEQAGATVLMAEYSPPRRRGLYSALPFIGIQAGTLLASAVFTIVSLAGRETLLAWLWRVPFLASALLIVIGLYIRLRLEESPTFSNLEQREQVSASPIKEIFRNSRPSLWRGFGLRMAENGGSYLYNTLAVSFVVSAAVGASATVGSLAVVVASLIGMMTIPVTGRLSDQFGRIPVYRFGAGALLVLAFPGWWLMSHGNPVAIVLVVALSINLGVNTMLGAQCAMFPEMFGASHRYIGVAVSREFSAVIAGGLGPVIGALLLKISNDAWWPLAIYVAVLAGITFLTTFAGPETRDRDLDLANDAVDDTADQTGARPPRIQWHDQVWAPLAEHPEPTGLTG